MPTRLALLCIPVLTFLSANAFAQNPNDFLKMFGGIIQQGMIQAATWEWQKLPADEVSCINQALRQQGASIYALADRGILPSDPRLIQLRSNCRSDVAQTPPSPAQSFPYVVDGLALGGHVKFESNAYKQYNCSPSDKFPRFTWCHKEDVQRTNRGEVTLANSILHTEDGTAWYVNRYIEPAFFGKNDVPSEIDRMSAKFGERPREFHLPRKQGLPDAVIAVWGKIQLHPLDQDEVTKVAAGGAVKGLLISFLGDLERSAKANVPVYRLQGGAGFLWAATYNQDGRGVLRFLTVDASKIDVGEPSGSPGPSSGFADIAELTTIPQACATARELPFSQSYVRDRFSG